MDFNDYYGILQQQIAANNSFSAQQAQNQMDFQERMSNTAHQREVADLKAAGLNPILSAHGNGASTPNGASATADPSSTSALVNLLGMMIETENANAKAQLMSYGGSQSVPNSASSSNGPSHHSSTSHSALQLSATDVQGVTGLPKAVSDGIASFVNGYTGAQQPKENKSTGLYNAGKYTKSTEVKPAYIDHVESTAPIKKAVSAVKDFASWLFTGKK